MINLPDHIYNRLKWLAMVFLPALATLYSGLSDTWGLPYGQQVPATIMAIVVFLGIFLQINSAYHKLKVTMAIGQAEYIDISARFVLSNAAYDAIKWVTMILLPSLSTLYVALSDVWNLPFSLEVSATVSAIVLFLGALLQISSLQYKAAMLLTTGKHRNPLIKPYYGIFTISSETYDILKFIAQGLLPGLAVFYTALASIWNLPYSEQISSTIMAVVLFMNGLLQISTAKYNAYKQRKRERDALRS